MTPRKKPHREYTENGVRMVQLEQLETDIAASRQRFLIELTKHPDLAQLYSRLIELEHVGIDARRARREAEIREG